MSAPDINTVTAQAIKFILENTAHAKTPEGFIMWANEFVDNHRCGRTSRSLTALVRRTLRKVEDITYLDYLEKVQILFVLSQPVSKTFQEILDAEDCEYNLDKQNRILSFRTTDGRFKRSTKSHEGVYKLFKGKQIEVSTRGHRRVPEEDSEDRESLGDELEIIDEQPQKEQKPITFNNPGRRLDFEIDGTHGKLEANGDGMDDAYGAHENNQNHYQEQDQVPVDDMENTTRAPWVKHRPDTPEDVNARLRQNDSDDEPQYGSFGTYHPMSNRLPARNVHGASTSQQVPHSGFTGRRPSFRFEPYPSIASTPRSTETPKPSLGNFGALESREGSPERKPLWSASSAYTSEEGRVPSSSGSVNNHQAGYLGIQNSMYSTFYLPNSGLPTTSSLGGTTGVPSNTTEIDYTPANTSPPSLTPSPETEKTINVTQFARQFEVLAETFEFSELEDKAGRIWRNAENQDKTMSADSFYLHMLGILTACILEKVQRIEGESIKMMTLFKRLRSILIRPLGEELTKKILKFLDGKIEKMTDNNEQGVLPKDLVSTYLNSLLDLALKN